MDCFSRTTTTTTKKKKKVISHQTFRTLMTWKKKKSLKRDQLKTTSTEQHTTFYTDIEKENVFDKLHNESEYIYIFFF